MAKKTNMGKWIDKINSSIGKYIHVETSDGLRRSGKLTGFRTKDIKVDGDVCQFIEEVELNGDPMDSIPINILSSIEIEG